MQQLYMKQKVFSIGEKFTVTDDQESPIYYVEGSFMQIPKTFEIYDQNGDNVCTITKKVFSLLPKFFVDIEGQPTITIIKEFTLFKPRYTIDSGDISVTGDWWDMDFEVSEAGSSIAQINKKWFSWGDTYEITVFDDDKRDLIVSLVVAIDRVKADQAASSSSSSSS